MCKQRNTETDVFQWYEWYSIEFITCVKSIEEDYIHPTVGLKVPDEECDLDYTLEPVTDRKVNYVMSNSLGFGGHNATLLVKKFED